MDGTIDSADDGESKVDRIAKAASGLLSRGRSADVTIRAVAERAEVSAAAVQREFGSRDRLLSAAHQLAFERDCAFSTELSALPTPLPDDDDDLRCALLESRLGARLGCGLDVTRARLAAQIAQARGTGRTDVSEDWFHALSRDLRAIGFDDDAALILLELMTGLELLSLGCREHPLLPMINREMLRHGIAIARRRWQPRLPPWFLAATHDLVDRARATEAIRGRPNGTRKPRGRTIMLESAQRIATEQGFATLSHRSVASHSGAALSHVSREFPTISQLLHALYRHIHTNMFELTMSSEEAGLTAITAILAGGAKTHLLSAEANLFAASEPPLAKVAWDMRMSRGTVMWHALDPAIEISPDNFDHQFMSIWMSGCLLLLPTIAASENVEREFRKRLEIMGERVPAIGGR